MGSTLAEPEPARPGDDRLVAAVSLACVLEVSAPKPGNITPSHGFADTTFADMVRSGLAIGPVLARADRLGIGALIEQAVQATAAVAAANTNLGIVLLFAPLARAAASRDGAETLRDAVERALADLTVADAAAAFAAIARAAPGGLGDAPEHDVRAPVRVDLRTAMAAAADRDDIASEYATGYAIVFDAGLPALTAALRAGRPTLEAIADLHLWLLASRPDTLIARKAGRAAAREVADAAGEVLRGERTAESLDAWLRAEGNRRNPGTTADLVAATLLAALLTGVALP
ncbi:MAG: triphosphoribosyl-dephospho-CoA synthase [Solirubrobacterales bacterium]|nr:triphosphoribosyl-dephospho-CoA synthase [Solirubrobacterales bacterium]